MTEAPPALPLDDETAAALTLFNAYVQADREQRKHQKKLTKAQRTKEEAAAAVRKMEAGQASSAERAEVEAAYRDAVDTLKRLRGGTDGAEPGHRST